MKKTFILPSLEVKKFNRVSVITMSDTNSNVADAKAALNDASVNMVNIATYALQ